MKYSLTIYCTKSRLREIRAFTEDILRKHQMNELERSSVVLAIDEVCANLIIHGHHGKEDEELKLQIDVKPNKVVFDIIDTSEMFNINQYETPKLEDIIKKQCPFPKEQLVNSLRQLIVGHRCGRSQRHQVIRQVEGDPAIVTS